MKEPRWVPRLVIDATHLDQLREHGGLPGLRDEHGLEAALARPRQQWHYRRESDTVTDLAALAAAYAYGISQAHPFSDGNKRMALLSAVIFLGMNGWELEATELDVVRVMTALAAGDQTEAQLAAWIRSHLARSSR